MDGHHCSECAQKNHGFNPNIYDTINFTGSSYLLGKYLKHAQFMSGSGAISVYASSDYDDYRNCLLISINSGSVDIANGVAVSAVWNAYQFLGDTSINGVYSHPCFENKVVKLDDLSKTHGYCTNSFSIPNGYCVDCGKLIQ
jgi:hypothetical protein